jgi:surfactin synthase thioesterase subunit
MSNEVSPADAMLAQAMAHSLGLAMYNSVNAQQQGAIIRQAATIELCAAIVSLGVSVEGKGASGSAAPLAADSGTAQPASPAEVAATLEQLSATAPEFTLDAAPAAGQAYQSVAQSAAIAVQDAADLLRNMDTISTTALGVAMAQLIVSGKVSPNYEEIEAAVQRAREKAIDNFRAIGRAAADMLKDFPR